MTMTKLTSIASLALATLPVVLLLAAINAGSVVSAATL